MKKIVLQIAVSFIIFLSSHSVLRAEEASYSISNYFAMDTGNTWEYEVKRKVMAGSEKTAITGTRFSSVTGPETLNGKEVLVLEEDADNGPWFYIAPGQEGILLYKIKYKDSYYLADEPAPVFYPYNLQSGKNWVSHAFVSRYDLSNNLIDTGRIEIRITLKEPEDKTTPAGNFENCLTIYRTMIIKTDGASVSTRGAEGFAQGIGKIWAYEEEVEEGINYRISVLLRRATIKGQKIGVPSEDNAETKKSGD